MTIDPRVGFYLSLALAILGFLSGSSAALTDLMGPEHIKPIMAIIGLTVGIGNSINAVLHAIPSKSGPDALKEFYLAKKPEEPKP